VQRRFARSPLAHGVSGQQPEPLLWYAQRRGCWCRHRRDTACSMFPRESVLSEACGQGLMRVGTVSSKPAGFLLRTGSFLSGFRRSRPSASTVPVPIRGACHGHRPLAHTLTGTGFMQRAPHPPGYWQTLAGCRRRRTPVRLMSTPRAQQTSTANARTKKEWFPCESGRQSGSSSTPVPGRPGSFGLVLPGT
jgi:hypothetical protein